MATADLTRRHFEPPATPEPPEKRSMLSQTLNRLFGAVRTNQKIERAEIAGSFAGLVRLLADTELGQPGPLPTDEQVAAVLKSTGKTLADLERAVAGEVEIAKLRDELAGEAEALEALSAVAGQITERVAAWERAEKEHAAAVAQLQIEKQNRASDCERFKQVRARLYRLIGQPSQREAEITEQIKSLMRDEMTTRNRAGNLPLADRFICSTPEQSTEGKDLATIQAAINQLEARSREIAEQELKAPKPGAAREQLGIERRLRRLLPKRDELREAVEADRRHFELGARVLAIRNEIQELRSERDGLEQARRAAIEGR